MKLADIIIPDYLAESVPNEAKMNRVKRYFLKYGELDKPIIINHKKELVDGYIRYLVLKEFDVEHVKQYRYERENKKVVTYIYGKHPNQQSDKEYVWRVPTSEKWNMFMENISVGDASDYYCGSNGKKIAGYIEWESDMPNIPSWCPHLLKEKEGVKTRNPTRIDKFTAELNRIWKKYFPDWRFGQFMMNFLGFVQSKKKRDPFFPEESEMLTYLKEYCGEKEDING